MHRRSFLQTSAAMAAVAEPKRLIFPRALQRGDTVGLITPSSYVSDPDELEFARRFCRFFGLELKMAKHVGARQGYLAGTARERVDDLHAMFADPAVRAIFCIRGGYGSAQMLPLIDFDLIRRNPKIFLGYSDITALHTAIGRMTGLVTFHGPVPLSHLSQWSQQHLAKALFDKAPLGIQINPPDTNPLQPAHTLRTIRPGKASGPLTGGNLTLLSTTLGTPWEIETEGRILLLEDIGEDIYRIDRMLTQLRLAGKLQRAGAIVVGECKDCPPPDRSSAYSLGEVLDYLLGDLGIPVYFGLSFGHTTDQVTLPLGVHATVDADAKTLTVTESAVAA